MKVEFVKSGRLITDKFGMATFYFLFYSSMLLYKADNYAVGLLTDQSTVHKEKTHTLSVSNYLPLYKKNRTEAAEGHSEVTDEEEGITSRVYLCATMWHENRDEMKQLLTSAMK